MADEKISQLADGGAPLDTDQLVIARSGSSLSLLFSAIKAAIPGGVASVFGRTGAVTAQSGDYTAAQVGALPSTETLDQIATANVTAANWSNNSHKITSLANGSGAQDAAAFGQIPTALPPNGTAGGDLSGTYPNPSVAPAANVAMGSHKLTGLAAGTGAGDSVRFEQIPTALPPNGTAGGDLSGTYPNPAVKAITETSGPTDLTIGTITDGQFLKRVGSTLVSAAGGGFSNPMTTKGDIIIEDASPAPARLAIGATGQVLTVASGLPAWATPFTKIYDNTLGSAGNFDTGAASIPAGFSAIMIVLMGRATVSSSNVDNQLRFNNDSGSNYLDLAVRATASGAVSAVADAAGTSAEFGQIPAGTATANYAGIVSGMIASYDQTTFFKQVVYTGSFLKDTTPSGGAWAGGDIWTSTAAITRIQLTANGTTYVTGSRLIVYGLP